MNINTHPPKDSGISKKLNKVFLIQILFISIATIAGVFGAAKVVENVLIKEALIGEADFYWNHYDKDPNFTLPKTMNLSGYLVKNNDYSKAPKELLSMEENFQRVPLNHKLPIVYVTEKNNEKLYLVFEEAQVSKLALYFGITPLVIVLLIIYLPAFISYVLSKRAISPILKVIKKIESLDVNKMELDKLDFSDINSSGNAEGLALIESFENFSHRISNFVKRERNFSRYASHELRTPLSVLKGSLALLDKKIENKDNSKIVHRMQLMVEEMQELIESLLLLSREQNLSLEKQSLIINDFAKPLIERVQSTFIDKNITLNWKPKHLIESEVSEQLLSIVLNNLLRNAFLYSPDNSEICVEINDSKIIISDQGSGMNEEQLQNIFSPFYRADEHSSVKGFGLGLAIVDWICQQSQWDIQFTSEVGVGTIATLDLIDTKRLS